MLVTASSIGKKTILHTLRFSSYRFLTMFHRPVPDSISYFSEVTEFVLDSSITNPIFPKKLTSECLTRMFTLMHCLKTLVFRVIIPEKNLKRTLGFSSDDLIISIVMGCKKLKSLSLFMPDLQDCHIGAICMHLRALNELNIWGNVNLTEISLEHIGKLSSTLECLEIGGYGMEIKGESLKRHIGACRKLKKLNISRCYRIADVDLISLPDSLEYLDISYCPKMKDCNFITRQFKQLKSLRMIQTSKEIMAQSIHQLNTLSHCLQELNLRDINMTDEQLIQAVKPLVNLTNLDLSNCPQITSHGIMELFGARKHSKLTHLNLLGIFNINEKVITEILVHLPLISLKLSIPKITDEIIINNFCNTPLVHSLKQLELSDCELLTNNCLLALTQYLLLESFAFSGFNPQKVDEKGLKNLAKYQIMLHTLYLKKFHSISQYSIENFVLPLKDKSLTRFFIQTESSILQQIF
jgi:hypothetical protein